MSLLPPIGLPMIGEGGIHTDPSTKKKMRMDMWKTTALHEIGHAVDAAYKIMDKHQGKRGCGGWVKRSPAELMPQYNSFLAALRGSGVPDRSFLANVTHERLKKAFAAYAFGVSTAEQIRPDIEAAWVAVHLDNESRQFNARVSATGLAISRLNVALNNTFLPGRVAADPDVLRTTFREHGSVADDIVAISITEPVIRQRYFWIEFDELAGAPAQTLDGIKSLMRVGQRDFAASVELARVADRIEKVARWTGATVAALPGATPTLVEDALKRFRSAAEPWNRDISGEQINGVAAAQEGNSGDEFWWSYSGADRGSTFVSNYQWRAPGEWFAELYAVTWLRKVEPPGGVGKDVRPYLFGGSIRPDAV
jgi:hypothetical protein